MRPTFSCPQSPHHTKYASSCTDVAACHPSTPFLPERVEKATSFIPASKGGGGGGVYPDTCHPSLESHAVAGPLKTSCLLQAVYIHSYPHAYIYTCMQVHACIHSLYIRIRLRGRRFVRARWHKLGMCAREHARAAHTCARAHARPNDRARTHLCHARPRLASRIRTHRRILDYLTPSR